MNPSQLTVKEAIEQGYTHYGYDNGDFQSLSRLDDITPEDFEYNEWRGGDPVLAEIEPTYVQVETADLYTDLISDLRDSENCFGDDTDEIDNIVKNAVDWDDIAAKINVALKTRPYYAAAQEPDNLQVLTEFIKSDPTIGELVDKSLAMGLAPTVEFVDKQEPDGPAGDIPSDITDWLVDKNPYAGYFEVSEAWHDGGIAMYRRNVSVLEKQNVRILGHIKKRQDLESELSTAKAQIEALQKENARLVAYSAEGDNNFSLLYGKWEAQAKEIEDFKKELAEVHGKIEDLNNWHHSHLK